MTLKLLTPKEVGDILSISMPTVYANPMDLPKVKISGCLRFREEDVQELIERSRVVKEEVCEEGVE